jgi:hypothetical protein
MMKTRNVVLAGLAASVWKEKHYFFLANLKVKTTRKTLAYMGILNGH